MTVILQQAEKHVNSRRKNNTHGMDEGVTAVTLLPPPSPPANNSMHKQQFSHAYHLIIKYTHSYYYSEAEEEE